MNKKITLTTNEIITYNKLKRSLIFNPVCIFYPFSATFYIALFVGLMGIVFNINLIKIGLIAISLLFYTYIPTIIILYIVLIIQSIQNKKFNNYIIKKIISERNLKRKR
jgi:hypothetical protein